MRLRDEKNYSWDELNNPVKNYSNFYNVGCTKTGKKGYKGDNGLIKLVHYQIGVRCAYIAWKIGISANLFTFIRLILTISAFYLIMSPEQIHLKWKLIGVFILFLQKAMDYGDGCLSRILRSSSPVGREFDVMTDFAPKIMILYLLASISEYSILIPLSGLAAYMFYCSDQWIRHDSYGLPRIYMIEYTINPNFIEYDEFYPVPKFNYILNLFFTYPVMLYLISILISMFRFNPFFGLSSEIYSNAFATLFLFYFIIISYRYLSILKSIQIINKKDN